MNSSHVEKYDGYIKRSDRNTQKNHKSGLIWLTGLSASGKSTIAHYVEKELFHKGMHTFVLDGDNIRHGLNSNLGFSREERKENIRRIAEVSKLMIEAGIFVIAAFISPYRADREYVRKEFEGDNYTEIYIKCSVDECERRDPKGQYKKAHLGIIKNYTGVSAPYEEPEKPDLIIDTEKSDIKSSVKTIISFLEKKNYFSMEQL